MGILGSAHFPRTQYKRIEAFRAADLFATRRCSDDHHQFRVRVPRRPAGAFPRRQAAIILEPQRRDSSATKPPSQLVPRESFVRPIRLLVWSSA
jgi:hypothetical protein